MWPEIMAGSQQEYRAARRRTPTGGRACRVDHDRCSCSTRATSALLDVDGRPAIPCDCDGADDDSSDSEQSHDYNDNQY